MKPFLYLLSAMLFFISCGTTKPAATAYFDNQRPQNQEPDPPITQSLFIDKNATISEENIQKILDGSYKLPQQLRVAVVKLNNTSQRYYWNDEQYLKTQQAYLDLFTERLKQSARVTSVSTIPDLLLTQPQTFTTIREAAVRIGADIVVVYSITADLYSKYKLFTKTEIKAFATTQLIVLDVRTGLVPFSTIVTKDQLSKKGDNDLDNNEAANRTQKEAVLLTINEIGNRLAEFFNKK